MPDIYYQLGLDYWLLFFNEMGHIVAQNLQQGLLIEYRVIKKSLCTWRFYCNNQVHRDFLITLY